MYPTTQKFGPNQSRYVGLELLGSTGMDDGLGVCQPPTSRKQSPKLSRKGTIAPSMEERRRQRSVRRWSYSPTSSPVVTFPQLDTPSPTQAAVDRQIALTSEYGVPRQPAKPPTVGIQCWSFRPPFDGGDQIWVWFRLWGDDDVSEARNLDQGECTAGTVAGGW
ncbi:hypothetical protein V6N11_068315 [Hibiscus sabdariffa]|uniref:Uncharacterized protein n=1 Tax=Hibiscus sabdariffa TaxID=183260 RepID=A0ABR2A6T6_9ROSI